MNRDLRHVHQQRCTARTCIFSVKRDLFTWRETYIHEQRFTSHTRTSTEIHSKNVYILCRTLAYLAGAPYNCLCQKRHMYMKRDLCTWIATSVYVHSKRPTPKTWIFSAAPWRASRVRHTICPVKRDICTWRETYVYVHHKRCTAETCMNVFSLASFRSLRVRQELLHRSLCLKETYVRE